MDKKLHVSQSFKIILFAFIGVGILTVAAGFLTGNGERTWATLLQDNFYFLSVALGALFWMAIQSITQSGWSAAFVRIPQAMSSYLVVAFILWLFLFINLHGFFHWSTSEAVSDPVLAHKAPYLNILFLAIRFVVFFGLWILLTFRIRKLSLKEDTFGGLTYFNKIEFNSKVFIFILGISFIFFPIDWLMSLEPHWFSTLFSVKYFVSAFYHGSTIIIAIVIILHKLGYFPFLTKGHLHNFSKYIFMLSIMWGYMWFVQYLLIWYGNIPEETSYYLLRRQDGFKTLFLAEIFINWFFPFLFLMWNRLAKNSNALLLTVGVLFIGQWIEIYNAVYPPLVHHASIGLIEIGTFVGFAALFTFVVVQALAKHPLIAKNHPYLVESLHNEDIEEEY